MGTIWKCCTVAGLCRPFSRTALLATTGRKSDNRLSGSSLASSVPPPSEGLQLSVPDKERHELIRRFHNSLFAGHLGVTRTVFHLLDRVYWPDLRRDVRTYIVHSLPGAEVTVPAEGSHGTCGSGP